MEPQLDFETYPAPLPRSRNSDYIKALFVNKNPSTYLFLSIGEEMLKRISLKETLPRWIRISFEKKNPRTMLIKAAEETEKDIFRISPPKQGAGKAYKSVFRFNKYVPKSTKTTACEVYYNKIHKGLVVTLPE